MSATFEVLSADLKKNQKKQSQIVSQLEDDLLDRNPPLSPFELNNLQKELSQLAVEERAIKRMLFNLGQRSLNLDADT